MNRLTCLLICFFIGGCTLNNIDDCPNNNIGDSICIGGSDILFRYLENKIEIKNYLGDFENLQLRAEDKSFTPNVEEKLFYVTFDKPGTHHLRLIDKTKNIILSERKFSVASAPLPTPSVYNVTPHEHMTSKQQLLTSKGIYAELYNWQVNFRYPIIEFSVLSIDSGKMVKIKNKGGNFNNQQKKWIESLNSGDFLIITDILIETPDKINRKLSSLVYEIK